MIVGWILFIVFVIWAIGFFYLRGEDLSSYDLPEGQQFSTGDALNEEHQAVHKKLSAITTKADGSPASRKIDAMRERMDAMFAGTKFDSAFVAVNAAGVSAEWVIAPGVDSHRRVLYIHGGAFVMGSPLSHRVITTKFSKIANAAVLAIDYRLMPENKRFAGIEDCRTAYQWILENGPQGPDKASYLIVAGDSAGGNLTLSTIAWARDQNIRSADAAIALSPATDSTFSSPSMKNNIASDVMLGTMFKLLSKIPKTALLWMTWFNNRINPRDSVISPTRGNLSNLPPTLVHASGVEMLRDDARRYVNKATAAGSIATLQVWDHVVHVWHIFDPDLTEARQAFDEIENFIERYAPNSGHHPDE